MDFFNPKKKPKKVENSSHCFQTETQIYIYITQKPIDIQHLIGLAFVNGVYI